MRKIKKQSQPVGRMQVVNIPKPKQCLKIGVTKVVAGQSPTINLLRKDPSYKESGSVFARTSKCLVWSPSISRRYSLSISNNPHRWISCSVGVTIYSCSNFYVAGQTLLGLLVINKAEVVSISGSLRWRYKKSSCNVPIDLLARPRTFLDFIVAIFDSYQRLDHKPCSRIFAVFLQRMVIFKEFRFLRRLW